MDARKNVALSRAIHRHAVAYHKLHTAKMPYACKDAERKEERHSRQLLIDMVERWIELERRK